MDIFDRATEVERMHREAALSMVGVGRDPGPPPVFIDGVACCAECGEPIGEQRMAACPRTGLCVECAP